MKKWDRFTDIAWKLMVGALIAFCVLSLYFSFFRANFSNITIDMYNPLVLLIASAFYIALLLLIRGWLNKKTEKQLKVCAAVLMLIFFVGLLFVGLSTRIIPKVDLQHAYIEAINMLETGVMTDKWQFERFPHQKAVVFMLYFVYRLTSAVGITNYRVVGIVFNAVMVTLALFFLYKLIYDHKGRAVAIVATAIFVCNPVMYFYSSYFYSDTLCLPFMMGGLWLAGRGLKETVGGKKICLLAAAAAILMLGAEVRATVIFAAFAVLFVAVSTTKRKQALLACLALCVGLLAGKVAYKSINVIYAKDIAEDMGHPITHYVMMGSNEATTGQYSVADDRLTSNLESHREKVAGNMAVIMERLHSMGLGGTLKLIKNKIALVWGDGRMGFHAWNAQMEQYGVLYEYSMGDKAIFLRGTMQFMRCSLYILMLAALTTLFQSKKCTFSDKVSVIVCLAGFVFYVLWEVQPRYSLMYLPVMSVLAGTGIEALYSVKDFTSISIVREAVGTNKQGIIWTKKDCIKTISRLLCIGMALTVFLWVGSYGKYVGDIRERSEMRVNQEAVEKALAIDQEGIIQAFIPKDAFNCVSLKFRNNKVMGNEYCLQILDKNMNVLTEQSFLSDTVSDNKYKLFRFDTICPENEMDCYYIKIFSTAQYETDIQVSSVHRKHSEAYASGYDFYPGGDVIKTDVPEHTDLVFRVTNIKMRSIVSKRVYLFLSIGSLLLEGAVIIALYWKPSENLRRGETINGKYEANP